MKYYTIIFVIMAALAVISCERDRVYIGDFDIGKEPGKSDDRDRNVIFRIRNTSDRNIEIFYERVNVNYETRETVTTLHSNSTGKIRVKKQYGDRASIKCVYDNYSWYIERDVGLLQDKIEIEISNTTVDGIILNQSINDVVKRNLLK
jgi:hypothetical protein